MTEVLNLAIRCHEAQGQYKEALTFFTKHEAKIVDLVARHDYGGRLYFKTGNKAKAIEYYEELLQLNTADLTTYYKILEVNGIQIKEGEQLSASEQSELKKILLEYQEKIPKASAPLRLAIRYTSGDDFSELLERHVRPLLIKGVPSMMQDLKEFYTDADKVQRIGSLLDGFLSSMEAEMTLSPDDEEEQDPTVKLWLYYF